MQTVAIVGVGLIGGSFARALRAAGFSGTIIGVSSEQTAARALAQGVIDRAEGLEQACAKADLVYLSHTISRILDVMPQLGNALRRGALVTDAGSTKVRICAQAARHLAPGSFLGGHPMAGKESRGLDGADARLFAGRTYVLTPADPKELEAEPQQELIGWIRRIGARPCILSAPDHDRIVALTSHLPQIASTVLAATVSNRVSGENLTVAGSGLTDMTRLALSSHEIWRDILETNREAITAGLERYIDELESFKRALQSDPPGVRAAFEAGAELAGRIRKP